MQGANANKRGESVIAVELSGNAKTGRVSATYASQASCPTSCPLLRSGCYAEHGAMAYHTRRVNAGTARTAEEVAIEEARAIGELSGRYPLRLHVVGDCPTDESARIVSEAAREYSGWRGQPVWAYTHGWRDVERASWGTVSVLASCETPADVRGARERGYATALVYAGEPQRRRFDVDGVAVVPCPQQTRDGVTCASCRLCFDDRALRERGVTIGFAAHGARAKRVGEVVRALSAGEER
jgi:hypothetical protein